MSHENVEVVRRAFQAKAGVSSAPVSARDTAQAMSQENVEVCKRMVDRWNLGDRSMPEEEVHPDVEVVSRFRSEPFRGRDGFRHWIEEIDRHFEDWRMVVDDWRDADDRVVALGSLQLRGRSSGLQLEESAGALVELTDGKVLRLHLFGDHAEALEAAGLSG